MGSSMSDNRTGLHGCYRERFTFIYVDDVGTLQETRLHRLLQRKLYTFTVVVS
jgi:hypothetical protein